MRDVNKIILIGRLGADPSKKETPAGVTVVNFPLATSRKFRSEQDAEGAELSEETQWHRIVVWGKQADTCAQFLKKGNSVFIEGMVKSRKYDGKDGVSRMTFEVHADNVSFLGGGRRNAEATQVAEAV